MNKNLVAQNLDLLLIVLESVYLSCMDQYYANTNSSLIILQLHQLRMNNPLRKIKASHELTSVDIYQCISMFNSLIQDVEIQKLIVLLLKEYMVAPNRRRNSKYLLKYKIRFKFFFYKYIDQYKMGKIMYNNSFIYHLSIFYLYILYIGSLNKGFYYLSYCLNQVNYYDLYRIMLEKANTTSV